MLFTSRQRTTGSRRGSRQTTPTLLFIGVADARISPKDTIDNRYLLWAIRSNLVQSLIDARTKGSTFNEITLGTLRKVPIPYPERLDEQQEIAEKLDKITEKLEQESAYLTELEALKRGLMQDLLTGKVRVNPDN